MDTEGQLFIASVGEDAGFAADALVQITIRSTCWAVSPWQSGASPYWSLMNKLRQEWFSNIRSDLLAGLVVALALIPEAIAFSIIAGVDPRVGLYASFCIAVVIAFAGGRPGMISAATGAMALLMVTLVKEHGLEYLFAATILTGILQIIAGWIRLGELMRFVSRSVVTGFVNALAILIFMAQLPELIDVPYAVYVLSLIHI